MQLLSVIHIFVEYLSGLVKGTDNIVGSLTASVMDMLSSFIGFCDGLQHVLYWHIAGQHLINNAPFNWWQYLE